MIVNVYLLLLCLIHGTKSLNNVIDSNIPDSKLNFTELATKYGYSAEEHKVTTEDGYILTMFRMRGERCEGTRLPVVMMHGLLLSSDSYLDAGPDAGLAYLLADTCEDLWVANCRGNYYSRAHIFLNPNRDPQFWEFDVQEIGYYDIPAVIDYVLDQTNADKVNYIGISQGAGTVFIMCSERPNYCEKLNLLIGLAPASRQTHTRSVFFRSLAILSWKSEDALKLLGVNEVFGKELRDILSVFCSLDDVASDICLSFLWILDSPHPNSVTYPTIRSLFGHFNAGTSLHNIAWYGQSAINDAFCKFDYGTVKNLVLYQSVDPPEYDLSASTMPVVILFGENDGLADPKDVKWLAAQLPNLIEITPVSDPKWTHLDNSYSKYIGNLTFPKIRDYLRKYN